MRLPDSRSLKEYSAKMLASARQPEKIALIYGVITVGITAIISVVQYFLGNQIDQTGGLQNIGTRSLFSAVSNFLPLIQAGLLMCLDFGYLAAMVRISRGQYTSPNTLRASMDRFWPLLRCTVLKNLLYSATMMICFYLSILLFFFSPFSADTVALLTPLVNDASALNNGPIVLDVATQNAIMGTLTPVLVIFAIVLLALFLPMVYRYRMANYILYDHPEQGAAYALRQSRMMMRRNRLALFRLDISFWWYFLLTILTAMIAYGDMLLPMVGISLPFSGPVGYFGFYFLSLGVQLAIYYFLRNRVEIVYAAAYNSLKPEDNNNGGVMLGNIFQM